MDLYNLVLSAKLSKGGGDANIDALSVTQNGTYTASGSTDGYSPVTVNVPNSYSASDEGKVVSSGALVAQTSVTKNANGTYDTTTNNSVTVNVPQPSGSISITQNGVVDVTQYANADVNVSGGGGASNVEYGEIECHVYDTNTVELSYSGNGYPTHLIVFEKTGSLIVDSGIFVVRLVKKDLATPMTYNGDLAYTTCNYYYGSKWNAYYSNSAYISPQGGSVTNQIGNCIGFTKENGVIKLHLKGKGNSTKWGVATGTYVYFVIFSE